MSLEATPTLAVTCRMADPAIIGATENAPRPPPQRGGVSPAASGGAVDEFIPAVPADGIVGAHRLPQPLAGLSQNSIADRMPVLVIDGLEVIQVQHGQADRVAAPVRPRQFLAQELQDHASVP